MAFDKDPAAIAANIAMRYPMGVRTRAGLPSAGFPLVGPAVPTMVTGNPDMISTRRRGSPLDSNVRWPDADHDVGCSCAEHQYPSEDKPDHNSTKHNISF